MNSILCDCAATHLFFITLNYYKHKLEKFQRFLAKTFLKLSFDKKNCNYNDYNAINDDDGDYDYDNYNENMLVKMMMIMIW